MFLPASYSTCQPKSRFCASRSMFLYSQSYRFPCGIRCSFRNYMVTINDKDDNILACVCISRNCLEENCQGVQTSSTLLESEKVATAFKLVRLHIIVSAGNIRNFFAQNCTIFFVVGLYLIARWIRISRIQKDNECNGIKNILLYNYRNRSATFRETSKKKS